MTPERREHARTVAVHGRDTIIERPDGSVPGVDVIHLHHAVWLARSYPMFAAGEEKTIYQFPRGFGYRHDPSDNRGMTDMIHNLMPNDDQILITWEVDFVPFDAGVGTISSSYRSGTSNRYAPLP